MEKFSNSLLWNFDEPQEERKNFQVHKKALEKMGRKSFKVPRKNTNLNSIMIIVFPYQK
jgi:hypothetical protein